MDPLNGLMRFVWSLVWLLLITALSFSVLVDQIGRHTGLEFWIGLALLGYVLWRVIALGRRVRGKRATGRVEHAELPPRTKWVAPRATDRRVRRF